MLLYVYLGCNKVVVRVCLLQQGEQTLCSGDGALHVRTLPHLEPLEDDFGPVQLFP